MLIDLLNNTLKKYVPKIDNKSKVQVHVMQASDAVEKRSNNEILKDSNIGFNELIQYLNAFITCK